MATVGQDYEPYRKRLKQLGIKQTHIRQLDNTFTAQAFITTDLSSNQIIAFHPGAMNFSEKNKVADAKGVKIGMVSPAQEPSLPISGGGIDGLAAKIAEAIERDIRDRGGLGSAWDSIDDDITDEIRIDWRKTIADILTRHRKES